jgi:DeoR family glycerol-3-phosphate regulon repressor
MHTRKTTGNKPSLDCQDKGGQRADEVEKKRTLIQKRHERIKQLVQTKGFVTIDSLAKEFNMTPQTLRKDINTLSEKGMLDRYHGGAGLPLSTENVEYVQRKVLYLKEKRQIARIVAEKIPDKSSLFINIGTTTEEIAKALCNHKGLRVITNNLNVASLMSKYEDFEIIIAGGLIRHRDGGIVGPLTIDFIKQFRVDYGIIGISAIDLDGTLLDFDYREVQVSRAIIDSSRNIFLAADHLKFGRNAMVRLANISEISALFTDREPPSELSEVLIQNDVKLYTPESDNDTKTTGTSSAKYTD